MANTRQQEVEENQPYVDRHGRWHNPSGAFASDEEAEEYEQMYGPAEEQQPPAPTPRRTPKAAPAARRNNAQARTTTQRSYRQPEPEPEPEPQDEEPEDATHVQGRLHDLMSEMFELHQRMGEVAAEIESEIGETFEPIMALAQRLSQGGTTQPRPRIAAKQSSNGAAPARRRGQPLNPLTDKRLKPATRERLMAEQQEEEQDDE